MKLAFSTLGCPAWSFEKILAEASRMGFDGIELRGVEGCMDFEKIPAFSMQNLKGTCEKMHSAGLQWAGLGTSVHFHDLSSYSAMLAEGESGIDLCERADMPFIRVFGDRISSSDTQEVISRVIAGLQSLCKYAEKGRCLVLLEVHGDFNRLETLNPVLDAMEGNPSFGILWDIEHSDKVYARDWKIFYKRIKPFIRHVHIKDHRRMEKDFALCFVGDGDIPIREIVQTLLSEDYSGFFSLEWEKMWHPELPEPQEAFARYVDFMHRIK